MNRDSSPVLIYFFNLSYIKQKEAGCRRY